MIGSSSDLEYYKDTAARLSEERNRLAALLEQVREELEKIKSEFMRGAKRKVPKKALVGAVVGLAACVVIIVAVVVAFGGFGRSATVGDYDVPALATVDASVEANEADYVEIASGASDATVTSSQPLPAPTVPTQKRGRVGRALSLFGQAFGTLFGGGDE